MKSITLLLAFTFSMTILAQVHTNPNLHSDVIKIPELTEVKYTPTKKKYRHLRVASLPLINGDLDKKALLVNIASASAGEKAYLTKKQKRIYDLFVSYLEKNNDKKSAKTWKKLIKSLKKTSSSIDLTALLNGAFKESYLEKDKDLKFLTTKLSFEQKQSETTLSYKKDVELQLRDCERSICNKYTVQTLEELKDQLKDNLYSMNEMSEMTSLRLQVTMERRSKAISTLSNMMKKISTTQDTLIKNIK